MFLRPLRVLFVFAAVIGAGAALEGQAAPAPPGFVGAWTMEQIPPGGTPRRQGTIIIARNGDALTGTMRVDGTEVPLSNITESSGIISFRVPAPDNSGVILTYSGAIQGTQLGVASQDLGTGSYTLTARRLQNTQQAQVAKAAPPAAAGASSSPGCSLRTAGARSTGATRTNSAPTGGIGCARGRGSRRLCRPASRPDTVKRGAAHADSTSAEPAGRRQRRPARPAHSAGRCAARRTAAACPTAGIEPRRKLECGADRARFDRTERGDAKLHAGGQSRRRIATVGGSGIPTVRRPADGLGGDLLAGRSGHPIRDRHLSRNG